jgi:hypothetical protein
MGQPLGVAPGTAALAFLSAIDAPNRFKLSRPGWTSPDIHSGETGEGQANAEITH